MSYNAIHPGKVWLDTSGKPIQAHGFSVFYNEQEKLWYWYGENKEKTVGGKQNTIWHWGVRLYTSPDLYNWTDKGQIISRYVWLPMDWDDDKLMIRWKKEWKV